MSEWAQGPNVDLAIKIFWPALVSLAIFWFTRSDKRKESRREPLSDIYEALDKAERAVLSFREKYIGGYKKDDEFVTEAISVFSRCSAFLETSKDVRKRLLLSSQEKKHVDLARQHLVKELLAIQYNQSHTPFVHGDIHVVPLAAVKAEIEECITKLSR